METTQETKEQVVELCAICCARSLSSLSDQDREAFMNENGGFQMFRFFGHEEWISIGTATMPQADSEDVHLQKIRAQKLYAISGMKECYMRDHVSVSQIQLVIQKDGSVELGIFVVPETTNL